MKITRQHKWRLLKIFARQRRDRCWRFLFTTFMAFIFTINFSGIYLWFIPLARSEGIHQATSQLGGAATGNGLNVYLFETTYNNASFVAPPHDRPVLINAEAGEVINISLCTSAPGNTADVEIFGPAGTGTASPSGLGFGNEINYNNATLVPSRGGGTVVGGLTNTATAGSNFSSIRITTGNARTATQTTAAICTADVGSGTKVAYPNGALTNAIKIQIPAGGAGTYEIRFNDSNATADNAALTYWDFTVTPNTTTNPDPKSTLGRVWAPAWAFNAGNSFANAGSYDGDFYVRTPGGRPSTEYIWKLDLNQFAPQRHDIIANGIGLNPPYSRYSAPGPSSTPAANPALGSPPRNRNFPIYLSYPTAMSFSPLLPEPVSPNILNFRFIDSSGEDNTITPNPATASIQDTGSFEFTTDVDGTYELTIDTNKNGVFGAGDKVFFGTISANVLKQVTWNGTDANGTALPVGTYPVKLQIRIGEYHFVAFDSETSGGTSSGTLGGGNGLTIWKATGSSSTSPTQVYWDDQTYLSAQNGKSNLPNGGTSGTVDGRHTWGNFASGSIGDTRFMDTWVFGSSQQLVNTAIIADVDDNDFGDAPDTYGTNQTNSSGEGIGASQILSTNIFLGTIATDKDTDGQPNVNADGDDVLTSDDEDGVTSFNTLVNNATNYTVTIKVKNTSGANAYLGGWIDFNRNGTFEASEGLVQTIATGTNGDVNLNWTGLSGLVTGTTYARFRINNDPLTTSDFIGGGRNGEVEDYRLSIIPNIDYGDAPDTGTGTGAGNYQTTSSDSGASHAIINTLKLGTNVADADDGTLQNASATADDTTGTDDEDGVTFPNTLTTNSTSYSATVNVTNTTGSAAKLVGWIDLNKNGQFEATEGVVQSIPNNASPQNVTLNWTGISGLTVGNTYARFRLSDSASLTTSTPNGAVGNGEVEDYQLTITNIDYGDAPDTGTGTGAGNYQTTSSDGGASHTIINTLKLGTNVADADDGTLQNASATADDTTATDDEDGVTFSTTLTTNSTSYSATVNVTNTTGSEAKLVGWIDLNKNGQFEATEGVAQSIPNNASPQNVTLNWTSITGLTVGNTYARFRLSDSASLTTSTPNGAVGNGEVEDYQLSIQVSNPNVLLVKRITKINNATTTNGGDNLAAYINEAGNPYDDNTLDNPTPPAKPDTDKWPDPNTLLIGGVNGGKIIPGDEIEYTIYFLSGGNVTAKNALFCDLVPANTTFNPTAFNTGVTPDPSGSGDRGIAINFNGSIKAYSNADDGDIAQYFLPGVEPTTKYPKIDCDGDPNTTIPNTNGAVVVNLGDVPNATAPGTPTNSYGFVRFRAQVN
ncbi:MULTISPECIES: beta strand repeat-containing protein [unclassified Calothrix]|uniref:beta strand repeat-containing protein n=1 Tax=unclassified Calothrix TaxID=2619626 RepID=UPI001F5589F4|nr:MULTISPECIES: GEVED domain-containing protein [unclassified Calothrix]